MSVHSLHLCYIWCRPSVHCVIVHRNALSPIWATTQYNIYRSDEREPNSGQLEFLTSCIQLRLFKYLDIHSL